MKNHVVIGILPEKKKKSLCNCMPIRILGSTFLFGFRCRFIASFGSIVLIIELFNVKPFPVLSNPIDSYQIMLNFVKSFGILWNPLESFGIVWNPVESCRIL